jgi:hypothetical protein
VGLSSGTANVPYFSTIVYVSSLSSIGCYMSTVGIVF